MAIKVCPNGHHYNTDDNDSCPYCEQSNSGGSFNWSEVDISENTSAMGGGWDRRTAPVGGFGRTGSAATGDWDIPTQEIGESGRGKPWTRGTGEETEEFPGSVDPGPTQEEWRKEYQHQPVVGWLVCIEGPDKGRDFGLHGAKSTIGRRGDSAVCLTDPKISRNGYPALVVYDDRKLHRFYLVSGNASSHNLVELNGEMLLGQSILNPYDEIQIEDSVMVFVPFCGEDFNWKAN